MNTAPLHETATIAAAVAAVTAVQELLLIPLSRLRPSSLNVRKSGGESILELAASIARLRLRQKLNVVLAADGEHYEAVVGRRRRAAPRSSCRSNWAPREGLRGALPAVADAAARTGDPTENAQR